MKFTKIAIDNFCSIGHIDYSLENQGLVVVEGENKDVECARSNGAGKSTALTDAMCWCLFGITTKGTSADQVLPSGTGRGTKVQVDLVLEDGRQVSVQRYRKHPERHNGLHLFLDGKDISRSTNPETDKQLRNLLRVEKDTFLYTTVLGQGLMFRFSLLTDQGRKKVLETIAELEIYEEARKLARTKAKEIKIQFDLSSAKLTEASNTLNILRVQLEQANSSRDQWSSKQREKTDLLLEEIKKNKWTATDDYMSKLEQRSKELEKQLTILTEGERLGFNKWQEVEAETMKAEAEARHALQHIQVLRSGVAGGRCSVCDSVLSAEALGKEEKRRLDVHALAADNVKPLRKQADQLRQRLDAINSKVTETTSGHLQVRSLMAREQHDTDERARKVADLEKRHAAATLEENPFERMVQSTTVNHKICQENIAKLQVEATAHSTNHSLHEWWVDAFQEIRVKVLENVLIFLNSRISTYTKILTDDEITAKLFHNDKGQIDLLVSTRGGSYESASGGEKDRIDIAVAFALHDLASQSTDFRCNVLMLDEIGGSLDDVGIERLMKLLGEKMERVESCFLISHNPIFRGYGDATWTVVRENGVSRLEVA